MSKSSLPVAIIGAGPVGLAAAAHALSRGLTPLVLEAGDAAGAGVRTWAHVRMFSPWTFNVDAASAAILARHGWSRPDDETYPTGKDLVERYLEPLAQTPELAPHIRLRSRVTGVARRGHDLLSDGTRANSPYLVRVDGPDGEVDILARAVIDASGTIATPGWLGASGLPAIGERASSARIFYGIPDVRGSLRTRYAGRRVLVVGSGHSAQNALLDLAAIATDEPATHVTWAIRRSVPAHLLGGARNDQLEERGKLGRRVRELLDRDRVALVSGFHLERLTQTPTGIVASDGTRNLAEVDEIIAATGFRPDWSVLREVRLDLDSTVESPRALAPLIDPNVHSCGTVPPHGADELKHPEAGVFAIGMKSYGRAPTFLLLTGYEQARSVVSAVAGDWEAARRVELVLPETGVCSTELAPGSLVSCCGSGGAAIAAPVALTRRTAPRTETAPPGGDTVGTVARCC